MTRTFLAALIVAACHPACADDTDPPQVAIGERLFLETRFAQYFAAHSPGGAANATLPVGDPVLETSVTTTGTAQGPFTGQSMNCRACHLVDELNSPLGNRTYNDFARRSPIPLRDDGLTVTSRNSPPLVNASLARPSGMLLHFDGEFPSGRALAVGTLTGRNYGWLASEYNDAVAHIAHIIRDDDGTGELAQQFGGRYRDVLKGAPTVPAEFRLPVGFRIDVSKANDAAILSALGRLIEAYLNSLTFSQDARKQFNGSPYDVFLAKNGLPKAPMPGETGVAYSKRLLAQIAALKTIKWVSNADRTFTVHSGLDFVFGPEELTGLRTFFVGSGTTPALALRVIVGGAGNCVSCHAPPNFTDFGFHNTGATQEEYDAIHGDGTFAALAIPGLATRNAAPNAYLPPSRQHPTATGIFANVPALTSPGQTDLGLWNTFANPDRPLAQAAILRALNAGKTVTKAALLPLTIGRFKTPGLRDLADSAPYLHTGGKDTLEDVVEFYRVFSAKARNGQVRNPAPELRGMALVPADVAPLAAFLRSLNEDYE